MFLLNKLLGIFKPKIFYTICHKEGRGTVAASYTVHAFNNEQKRNIWVDNTNLINRERTGSLLPVAFAIASGDVNVKKALEDVRLNPVVYSNADYINNRIYFEHRGCLGNRVNGNNLQKRGGNYHATIERRRQSLSESS